MNNKKTNIFKCFIYSITSFDNYKLFLRESTGKAIGYLVLLSLLISIAIFAPFFSIANEVANAAPNFIDEVIPDFNLVDGQLEVYGDMPIVMDSSDLPVVIDTTPGAEDRLLYQYDSIILITQDKMILKNYTERQEYPHSAYTGLELTKDSLIEALPIIKTYMTVAFIFIGILVYIFVLIVKFITVFIASIIGLIVNSSLKTNLSYKSIFKISLFAMTLPLIVCTILDVLPVNIPFMPVLFYAGTGVYIYGAIRSIKRELTLAGADNGGYGYYGNDTFNGNINYGNSNLGNYNYGNPTGTGDTTDNNAPGANSAPLEDNDYGNPTGTGDTTDNNAPGANSAPLEDNSLNENDDSNDRTE